MSGGTAATGLRLRRGRPADARALAALMRAAVRAIPAGAHPPEVVAAWASLPALYHRWAMGPGGETYLLARGGARLLGYAALRGDELTAVFVRPSAAGRGVGTTLVAAALGLARRGGVRRLRVVAAASAVPFYRRLGFREGRAASAPLPGGLALASRRMSAAVPRARRER